MDVDQEEIKPNILDKIISTMKEGKTSVIFAGTRERLNHYVNWNKNLYDKFSVGLQFNDLTCEELAEMIHEKMNEEDHFMRGYRLDSSCTVEKITRIISRETPEILRSRLNGYLVDQILEDAKSYFESRVKFNASGQRTIKG